MVGMQRTFPVGFDDAVKVHNGDAPPVAIDSLQVLHLQEELTMLREQTDAAVAATKLLLTGLRASEHTGQARLNSR
jgi:hypothetical protein